MENIQIIRRKEKRQNTHTQTQQPVGQYQVVKYTCNWSPGRRRQRAGGKDKLFAE